MFEFIKAISETVLDMINAVSHDKPLTLTRAVFWEKLVSHRQALNEADSCLLMRRRVGSKPWHYQKKHRFLPYIEHDQSSLPDNWSFEKIQNIVVRWFLVAKRNLGFNFQICRKIYLVGIGNSSCNFQCLRVFIVGNMPSY